MEDHDDLMPVFAAQSDLLSATYGEFFLADMIELQDNENKVSTDLISAPSAIRDPRGGNKNNAKNRMVYLGENLSRRCRPAHLSPG